MFLAFSRDNLAVACTIQSLFPLLAKKHRSASGWVMEANFAGTWEWNIHKRTIYFDKFEQFEYHKYHMNHKIYIKFNIHMSGSDTGV